MARSSGRALACALLVATPLVAATSDAQTISAEYQVKAAFVSKFPEFTVWPDAALSGRKTIELCIAGRNPFGTTLNDLAEGAVIHGRPLVTRAVTSADDIETCQVLFVSAHLSPGARKLFLARAARRPALTVGDYPGFLDDGGIVELRTIDGRVRFEIDAAAADRAGIQLSSQLLRLALRVRGRPL